MFVQLPLNTNICQKRKTRNNKNTQTIKKNHLIKLEGMGANKRSKSIRFSTRNHPPPMIKDKH